MNSVDEFGYTTFDHFLSSEIDLEALRVLVDAGASASTSSTILHTYLWTKNPCSTGIELLVRAGAKANVQDETDNLPIEIAASRNLPNDVFKALVDAGADASSSSIILHTILQNGDPRPDTLRLLIDAGAPVNSRDENGDAPIDIALEWEFKDEILGVLVEAGADVSQFPEILHKTLQGENPGLERVKLLVANGAPIDGIDDEEYSPLDIAFSNCVDVEIIWALIEAGADIEDRSNLLNRVLRNPSVKPVHVEVLTDMGVELNAKDFMWSTPIEIAIERDLSPEIFRVLVDAGAHWASYPNTVQDKLKRASGT